MSDKMDVDPIDSLLRPPSDRDYPPLTRTASSYNPMHSFDLAKGEQKHYQQQFSDMYFLRLMTLKPAVEAIAEEAWQDFQIAGETVRRVDRVLDVRQGELCWVAGTVYMDMPLKPNILEDISKDHWIAAPPPKEKFLSPNGLDHVMLEDDSGRLRLTGAQLQMEMLVTGSIIAVMGTENAAGNFEVIDMKVPDLPRQPQRWERDEIDEATNSSSTLKQEERMESRTTGGKVVIISGLGINGDETDHLSLDLFMEWLLGEANAPVDQMETSRISRLIIAGNSLAEASSTLARDESTKKTGKKYGYDASAYNPAPTTHLDNLMATLLPSIPITLLPGETDPANVSIPQQPIHSAMFPHSRAYAAAAGEGPGWFDCVTNPWEGDINGWRFMGTGGQPIDDIYKYVEGDDRIEMMEKVLRWRCIAPTAPDTLWSYPFQDKDQFVLEECPHVYFVGNQPKYDTTVIEGPAGQTVRLIALPKFKNTGEVVILDMETLEPEVVQFDISQDE